ncbi:very short patch repair endonuclease [Opitutaceae bacterium TAV4]|nr:very short patch repair endonuclease [Opitutaceae bacterium TAV4]RRK00022.1 very short patch repair endonuclease [Opitutaceae bacterium TAV3]
MTKKEKLFSGLTRSQLMSRIKCSGNKDTELRLIAIFRENGITGWRRKQTVLGKPDFVFCKPHSGMKRLAVFVDGCFWHGCPLHGTQPKNNAEFWLAKIARNQTRDQLVTRTLRARGWRVLRIWEHELARKNRARLLARLRRSGII